MKRSKLVGLIWLAVAVVLAFAVAGGSTLLIRQMPWSWEQGLAHSIPEPEVCQLSKPASMALNHLRNRLFPLDESDKKFSVTLHVSPSDEVNAFASLGGEIFINTGLLQKALSADEVAGVLAHEISHVKNRDVLEGVFGRLLLYTVVGGQSTATRIGAELMNLKYTAKQEARADEDGLARLRLAKIDSRAFAAFFERLEKDSSVPAILSDHPDPHDRAQRARKSMTPDPKPALSKEDWKTLKTSCVR